MKSLGLRGIISTTADARGGETAAGGVTESSRPRGLLYRHPYGTVERCRREHAERLLRLAATAPVRLKIDNAITANASRNVIAEIQEHRPTGRDRPRRRAPRRWDLGTGANDNGVRAPR
jgi:hypothetical protein